MDVAITQWINGLSGKLPLLDQFMVVVTQAGVPAIIALVILQWWSRQDRLHVRHAAVSAGLSFILGLAINQLLLIFIHRMRPYDAGVSTLLISPSADWSFPSDHATASIAVAAAFLMQKLPRRALVLLAMALLVSFSRVYVGTHYVTDVLGGAATGIVAALVVRAAYREGGRPDRILTGLF